MSKNMQRGNGPFQSRSTAMARDGMVATSQPLAAAAGLRILARGGNAIDAAVASAAVLTVVDPRSTGLGGDAFALVHTGHDGCLYGLNGSGRAPYELTVDLLRTLGHSRVPVSGPLSITVPGIIDGWNALIERFGTLGLDTVLAPAIDYAERGFPVTQEVAERWRGQEQKLMAHSGPGCVYLPGGKAPEPGAMFFNPDLALTLREVADHGASAFYRGPLAAKICQHVRQAGGVLSEPDLELHTSDWVEPVGVAYRGHTVWELPPNGQGLVALVALGILQSFPVGRLGHNTAEYVHLLAESVKLGFGDASRHVADPGFYQAPLAQLLSTEYLRSRASRVEPHSVLPPEFEPLFLGSDTVYLTVVDDERNAVSFINSIFSGFGSGVVVEGTGITLQNRASGFSFSETHPNGLFPGKRPYHTIIPAMITRDGRLWITYGVMGGTMQPQGHVQVACSLIDFGFGPQAALDAPRFRYLGKKTLAMEAGFDESVIRGLRSRGHDIEFRDSGQFGGGQIIEVEGTALLGGSDPRKDGCAIGL